MYDIDNSRGRYVLERTERRSDGFAAAPRPSTATGGHRLTRRLAAAALAVCTCWVAPEALAAPFVGEGFAPVEQDAKALAAHRVALQRARTAALEAALNDLPTRPAPEVRTRLVQQAAAWTGSYRVLQQQDDGATVRVVVEVEVDVAKLSKAVNAASTASPAEVATPGAGRPVLVDVSGDKGCAPKIAAPLAHVLAAEQVVQPSGPGPQVRIEVRCQVLGRVPYTGATAVEAVAIVRRVGATDVLAAYDDAVFVRGEQEALAAITRRLAGGVSRGLSFGDGDAFSVLLESPGPAERVRRIERRLRESVVGVRSVALESIDATGVLGIRVSGALSLDQLAARVDGLQVPGGQIQVISQEHPATLRIRLRAAP